MSFGYFQNMNQSFSGLERWMIRRFRRIYAESTGYRSNIEGYDGLIVEMKHSLGTFSLEQRLAFDAVTLPKVLGGPAAPFVRAWARKHPNAARKCFLALIPTGLRYLIGESRRDGNSIQIRHCRFLANGGTDLCQHVCKSPTEHFFAQEYHLKIRFNPDFSDGSCRLDFKS